MLSVPLRVIFEFWNILTLAKTRRLDRRRSRTPRERRLERGSRDLDRRVVPPARTHRQTERYKNERKRSRSPRSPYERQRFVVNNNRCGYYVIWHTI